MAKRMSMEQKVHKGLNKVQQFERTLWHATAESTLNEINRNGFNRSFSGAKHGNYDYYCYMKDKLMFCFITDL